jgi:hypothetical protein
MYHSISRPTVKMAPAIRGRLLLHVAGDVPYQVFRLTANVTTQSSLKGSPEI